MGNLGVRRNSYPLPISHFAMEIPSLIMTESVALPLELGTSGTVNQRSIRGLSVCLVCVLVW